MPPTLCCPWKRSASPMIHFIGTVSCSTPAGLTRAGYGPSSCCLNSLQTRPVMPYEVIPQLGSGRRTGSLQPLDCRSVAAALFNYPYLIPALWVLGVGGHNLSYGHQLVPPRGDSPIFRSRSGAN